MIRAAWDSGNQEYARSVTEEPEQELLNLHALEVPTVAGVARETVA